MIIFDQESVYTNKKGGKILQDFWLNSGTGSYWKAWSKDQLQISYRHPTIVISESDFRIVLGTADTPDKGVVEVTSAPGGRLFAKNRSLVKRSATISVGHQPTSTLPNSEVLQVVNETNPSKNKQVIEQLWKLFINSITFFAKLLFNLSLLF